MTLLTLVGVIVLACAVVGGMLWGNMHHSRTLPGEKDFFVPWLAARTFLEFGDSPYSEAATQRAQVVYYESMVGAGEDPLILWLPLPALLLYFPLAFLPDYNLAHGIWLVISETALVGIAWLAASLIGWKPRLFMLFSLLIMPIVWVYGLLDLINASPIPLALLALLGSLQLFQHKQDEFAGILLTLPIFMAGTFFLPILYLLWLVIRLRRWRVLAGLGMSLLLLTLISFLLLPGWIYPFLRGLVSHGLYSQTISLFRVLAGISPVVGLRAGWVIAALLALLLIFEWRKAGTKDARTQVWAVSLSLVLTPLMGVPLPLTAFTSLLIPAILIATTLSDRWRGGRRRVLGVIILLLLGLVSWLLLSTSRSGSILVIPCLLLIGLYWMRWWIIRPPQTYYETLQ
jgi:hypothetical protein